MLEEDEKLTCRCGCGITFDSWEDILLRTEPQWSAYTRRVHMPDGKELYVSDDESGDKRLAELYNHYADLEVDVCWKESRGFVSALDVKYTTTISGLHADLLG